MQSLELSTGKKTLERIKKLLSDLMDFPLEKAAGEPGFQLTGVKLS